MSVCAACGAEILWAVTAAGRRMPVDPEPAPGGNLAAYRGVDARLRARAVRVGDDLERWERRAMPHFATCPGRAQERPPPRPDGVVSLAEARDRKRRTTSA